MAVDVYFWTDTRAQWIQKCNMNSTETLLWSMHTHPQFLEQPNLCNFHVIMEIDWANKNHSRKVTLKSGMTSRYAKMAELTVVWRLIQYMTQMVSPHSGTQKHTECSGQVHLAWPALSQEMWTHDDFHDHNRALSALQILSLYPDAPVSNQVFSALRLPATSTEASVIQDLILSCHDKTVN